MERTYDVVICGAGIAGLTLGRQLRLRERDLSVAVIDREARPLAEHAHKVGESTVVGGAAYLSNVVDLDEYLRLNQLPKLGLRWFFGDSDQPLNERPELGRDTYDSRFVEWQIARGKFESDVREIVEEDGVDLFEGWHVDDIAITESDEPHTVACTGPDDEPAKFHGDWVVDALGRRHFLRQKLGLEKEVEPRCSAAWFRVEPKVDVEALGSAADEQWRDRVPGDCPYDEEYGRYNSTNHLTGEGYWVWLIPLAGNCTSIGIVAGNREHSFDEYNTFDRALDWLDEHEPRLREVVGEREQLDFRCMRNYSFNSTRFLSEDKWATTGEAAAFPDPWLSVQMDLVGGSNCMITDAIVEEYRNDGLSAKRIEEANAEYVGLNDTITHSYHATYQYFGHPCVITSKIIWDLSFGWGWARPLEMSRNFVPGFLADDQLHGVFFSERVQRVASLTEHVVGVLNEWVARSEHSSLQLPDYLDYKKDLPFLREMGVRSHTRKASPTADFDQTFPVLEAVAQAIFLVAVEDVLPKYADRLEGREWFDAWSIGLDPQRWEEDGLFEPTTEPAALPDVYRQLRSCFEPNDPRDVRFFE